MEQDVLAVAVCSDGQQVVTSGFGAGLFSMKGEKLGAPAFAAPPN
jgi:hypothetical protein